VQQTMDIWLEVDPTGAHARITLVVAFFRSISSTLTIPQKPEA
jgi:hypothetical protein